TRFGEARRPLDPVTRALQRFQRKPDNMKPQTRYLGIRNPRRWCTRAMEMQAGPQCAGLHIVRREPTRRRSSGLLRRRVGETTKPTERSDRESDLLSVYHTTPL